MGISCGADASSALWKRVNMHGCKQGDEIDYN
jgi:hypothetical protein